MHNISKEQARKIQPLRDGIVVQVCFPPKKAGELILPENLKRRSSRARVVGIGPGARQNGRLMPCTVKPGDIVILPKWIDPDDGEEQDERYLMGSESEILAIVGESTQVSAYEG